MVPAMMRRAILPMALSVLLAASLFVTRGQAAIPIIVSLSRLQWVAPAQARVDVTITGLQSVLQPTIEGSATLGGQVTQFWPPFPLIVSRFSAFLDLPAGRVRIGGDATAREFPPVPPLRRTRPSRSRSRYARETRRPPLGRQGCCCCPPSSSPGT